MRLWLLMTVVALAGAGCASHGATPSPTTVLPQADARDASEVRALASAYWEAVNAYDTPAALAMLEPVYRLERESRLRKDIDGMKLFKVTLGVSEESPPRVAPSGDLEMLIRMKEPLGSRTVRMSFRLVEGQWMITYDQVN